MMVSKLLGNVQPGDVLMDGLGHELLLVDRVVPARARGYVVVVGRATEWARQQHLGGETSGHRSSPVWVRE
jgi:hypothetical protein